MTFTAPFRLGGRGESYPAGVYEVETDEEIIEGNGHTVYRRVATLLFVRERGMTRTLTVDPDELEAALAHDRARQA